MKSLIDKIYFLWKNGKNLESKFLTYQGYRPNSIIEWINQTGLSKNLAFKILSNFEIYTAPKIRTIIRQIVNDNEALFAKENCFITGFGNAGKSGDIILYDFTHTTEINQAKIKKTWELNALPEGSTIIFVEDIIGTGTQSVDFIQNRVNQIIKPSHVPYIFSLCATPQGIKNISENTHFQVLPGILLNESHQHYTHNSSVFSINESQEIKTLNNLLKSNNYSGIDFDLGLMLAFYYSIPNNCMPIFWKDGYDYTDKNGLRKKWTALLPRRF